MISKQRLHVILNVAGFNATWFASVLGAANGLPWLGSAVFAAFCVMTLRLGGCPGRDLIALAVCAAFGLLLDSSYLWLGLVDYASHWPAQQALPAWLLVMWLNFGLTMNHSLAWLAGRPWLAAALGGFGGATSYFAGARLGAVDFLGDPLVTTLIIGAAWAVALPLMYRGVAALYTALSIGPAQSPR